VSDETPKYLSDDDELCLPSVDVCAWCSDSECDGIGCIAALDPADPDGELSELHAVIRAGKAFLGAIEALANAGQGGCR
jgi:hypothetical protein